MSDDELLIVAITAKGDIYDIEYCPFIPKEIIIDALESALKVLQDGTEPELEVKVDVRIADVEKD